jgi:hydrogenase maturation protease
MSTTIIIGMGNAVRRDDSVGLRVARELSRLLAGDTGVATAELPCGGMQLVETMVGYDRAIVIDAMLGGAIPGTFRAFDPEELPNTRTTNSTHDGSLQMALEFGRAIGLRLPGRIRIWAVEAGDVETLGETLTPPVERAVPLVVRDVMRELGRERQAERSE